MRQLVFLFLILFNNINVNAQLNRYSVFSVSKNIQVKQDSNWKIVKKHMYLGAYDELVIPANGVIKILDDKTKCIYKNNCDGTMTVRQLIKIAKSRSENSLSNLTRAFCENMSVKVENSRRLKSLGAAHRGDNSFMSFEDSVCSSIAYTANKLLNSKCQLQDSSVEGRRIVTHGTYIVHFENNSDSAYCVNVVSINKKERKCRLLLSPGYEKNQPYVILDAHTKVTIENNTFLSCPDECLLILASDRIFDNEEVNCKLENFQLQEGENLFNMQYSDMK